MTRKPRLTVEYSVDGWPRNDGRQPGQEYCRSVLARRGRGLDPCDDIARWKTTRRDRYGAKVGWYCAEDILERLEAGFIVRPGEHT